MSDVTPVKQPASVTPPQIYSFMDKINSGPAALLYNLSNQIIKIYNQLQELYSEVNRDATAVQLKEIQASASAQIAAGKDQARALRAQAVGSFANAAVTGAQLGGESYSNSSNFKTSKTQEAELNNLNSINELKAPPANVTIGDNAEGPTSPEQLRTSQMKNGTYKFDDDNDSSPAEIATKNQDAINAMNAEDHAAFKSTLQEKITAQEKALNTTQGRIQENQTRWNSVAQMANNGVNSISQGANALCTEYAANDQSQQQVASGLSQISNSIADSGRQNLSLYYSKISDVIAAARQGSQAYAQT